MEQSLYCHSFSTCHILYDTDLAYPNMNLNGAFDFFIYASQSSYFTLKLKSILIYYDALLLFIALR